MYCYHRMTSQLLRPLVWKREQPLGSGMRNHDFGRHGLRLYEAFTSLFPGLVGIDCQQETYSSVLLDD
jgi:hypothetical protein